MTGPPTSPKPALDGSWSPQRAALRARQLQPTDGGADPSRQEANLSVHRPPSSPGGGGSQREVSGPARPAPPRSAAETTDTGCRALQVNRRRAPERLSGKKNGSSTSTRCQESDRPSSPSGPPNEARPWRAARHGISRLLKSVRPGGPGPGSGLRGDPHVPSTVCRGPPLQGRPSAQASLPHEGQTRKKPSRDPKAETRRARGREGLQGAFMPGQRRRGPSGRRRSASGRGGRAPPDRLPGTAFAPAVRWSHTVPPTGKGSPGASLAVLPDTRRFFRVL